MKQEKIMPINLEQLHVGEGGILDRLRNTPIGSELREVLFDIARDYAVYLGVDFDSEILPNLGDHAWWEADYGVSEIEGRSIGMSVKDAFRCLVDTHRTIQIAAGIKETIDYLRQRDNRPLTAIDAGTGTGILSIILAAYGVDKVTAIEYNHETFCCTKDFLRRLKLDGVIGIVEGDATKIEFTDGSMQNVDILVSENLASGLMDEPQFDIIEHLSRYLASDAKILPFSATLSVAVANADWSGIDASKVGIQARKLKRCDLLSGRVPYAIVQSYPGMKPPTIDGGADFHLSEGGLVNTIVVSTDFQINEVGKPVFLDCGTAEFLGKHRAFRLSGEISDSDEVSVNLRYRVGIMGKYMTVKVNGTSIRLTPEVPRS